MILTKKYLHTKRKKESEIPVEPIEEHPVEHIDDQQVKINRAVPGDVYVHRFGMDGNNAVTAVTLADLLLLASSKHIIIHEKIKNNVEIYLHATLIENKERSK
jgi:hypothetical protein